MNLDDVEAELKQLRAMEKHTELVIQWLRERCEEEAAKSEALARRIQELEFTVYSLRAQIRGLK